MDSEILMVEDLGLPETFVVSEDSHAEYVQVCAICTNCCYTDCIGGN